MCRILAVVLDETRLVSDKQLAYECVLMVQDQAVIKHRSRDQGVQSVYKLGYRRGQQGKHQSPFKARLQAKHFAIDRRSKFERVPFQ